MQEIYDWLTSLPPLALYVALALTAAVENIFPPLPADSVVAFGSFLAARGNATLFGAFLATWIGNVAGAMLVYAVARHFGSDWLHARLERFGGARREHRLEALYRRYGLLALFLSRFLPGVRAIVPPFAGALRIPAPRAFLAISVASALWYGTVSVVAYRVGANWETLQERLGSLTRGAGLAAAAILAIVITVWLLWRRMTRRAS
ncbi:MAG: DedA family protein [Gemmatimonadota bacterium]|nr:DedA family protein [Gemmatimonadota bacterium]